MPEIDPLQKAQDHLSNVMDKAWKSMNKVSDELGKLVDGDVLSKKSSGFGGDSGIDLSKLNPFTALNDAQKKISGIIDQVSGALGNIITSINSAPVGEATGRMMGVLEGAITQVAGKFEELSAPIARFVEALSPGQMQVFNLALRDLNATVGVALLPVIQNLTNAAHNVAGELLPAMEKLAPVFDTLSKSLSSTLITTSQKISHELDKMSELLEGLAIVVQTLSDLFNTITTVLLSVKDALAEWITSLLGGGHSLTSLFTSLRGVVMEFTKGLVQGSVILAQTLGNKSYGEALLKNFKDLSEQKSGVGGALQNIHISGLEQISKDISMAAAAAVGPGEKEGKTQEEWSEEMAKSLEQIVTNNTTLQSMLETYLQNKFKSDITEAIRAAIFGGGGGGSNSSSGGGGWVPSWKQFLKAAATGEF